MSLRIYFERAYVAINDDQRTGQVGICAVRADVGGLYFYTDAIQIASVLGGLMTKDIKEKVAYASIKDSWVGDALRQPGEYQLGQAHISVSYHETDRWAANNTVNGLSKNLAELIELFQAIKVGNAQQFLRRDYGKPQGGPSYSKLEAQLKAANAARERDANLIRLLTFAVKRQQQMLTFVKRAEAIAKDFEVKLEAQLARDAEMSEKIADIRTNLETATMFDDAAELLELQFAHDLAEAKEDL